MKEYLKLIVSSLLIVSLVSCNANVMNIDKLDNDTITTKSVATDNDDFDIEKAKIGDEYSGFVLNRIGELKSIMSKTYTFTHKQSGATLYYMKNDDKNLGFDISYKTIHLDNSDTNHIFEHSILSSSDKYKSNDVFFDIYNKSFLSDCNATTYDTFTNYYFSTYDEEQLYKDMDVYLSCMVEPTLLNDKNIYKREAYRLTLYDKNDDLDIQGIVFQEDEGHSTSESNVIDSAIRNALYPSQYASCVVGDLVNNWQDSSYEKCIDRFNTFYNFDNSIIELYGDLDINRAMRFLDEEYLSKYETNKTDLTPYQDKKSIATHSVLNVDIPAFVGAKEEDQTTIVYAIDISDVNMDDMVKLEEVASLLSDENGLLYEKLANLGLNNSMVVALNDFRLKPYFCFYYYNANPTDRDLFMSAVNDTLYEIKEFGITNMNYESILKGNELNNYLARNYNNLFTDIVSPYISNYFSLFKETDYFEKSDDILSLMIDDKDQTILKEKVAYLYNADNTVLIAATPKAGMADKIREDRVELLKEMKSNMTDEELDNLIKETLEFDEWNEKQFTPELSFAIEAKDLPDIEDNIKINKELYDGITIYTAPCNVDGISSHYLIFDSSCVSQKDLYYITDLSILLSKYTNNRYSSPAWTYIKNIYLNGLTFDFDHLEEKAGDNCRPIFTISFNCYDKDYEKSIEYLLDYLLNVDFSDNSYLCTALNAASSDFDHSKDVSTGAYDLISSSLSYKYYDLASGQDYYYDLKHKIDKLEKDEKYAKSYQAKLIEIKNNMLRRNNFIIAHAANEKMLERFVANDKQVLTCLQNNDLPNEKYTYRDVKKKRAYLTEASNASNKKLISLLGDDTFSGADLSYWKLLSNEYIVPKIRYSGLAYSAACKYSDTYKLLTVQSYMDKTVSETYGIYNGMSQFLENVDVDNDKLNMYILSAYSDIYSPMTYLNEGMKAISDDIYCVDRESFKKVARELKNATINDKQHAIDTIKRFETDAEYVAMGNATMINKDKKEFDEIIDLRKEK